MSYVLSWITFLPIIGILLILFVPKTNKSLIKIVAALFTGLQFVLAIWIYMNFDQSSSQIQFQEHSQWIPSFNIEYFLALMA